MSTRRALTEHEIEQIGGGTDEIIVVVGGGGNDFDWWNWGGNPPSSNPGFGGGPGSGNGGVGAGDGLNDGDEDSDPDASIDEHVEIVVQGGLEFLQDKIIEMKERLGGKDFNIVVGTQAYSADALLKSLAALTKVLTLLEAAEITNDLLTGDASLGEALDFLAILGVGLALGASGLAPITVLALTVGAGILVPGTGNYVVTRLESAFNTMIASAVQTVGYQPADPSWSSAVNEYNFILHLFGNPAGSSGTGWGGTPPSYPPTFPGGGINNPLP